VNDILDFTRGAPQQVVFARLEFNLFIERVVSEFRPELTAKGITIEFANQPPTTKLPLNPQRLSRAFYNIVFNAVDVMPEGGTIRMRFTETDSAMITEIEDSGPGIAPDIAETLFEPFATFGKAKGTGLGLYITRRVVEEHHGTISARNQAGSGAVFSISLPKTR
jgi:two-component system, NtrC family, sensor histidine kinase HydH